MGIDLVNKLKEAGFMYAIGYGIVYVYKVSYYKHLEIPVEMIQISINNIASIFYNITLIYLSVLACKEALEIYKERKIIRVILKLIDGVGNAVKKDRGMAIAILLCVIVTVSYAGFSKGFYGATKESCEIDGVEYAVLDILEDKIIVGEVGDNNYLEGYKVVDFSESVYFNREKIKVYSKKGNTSEVSLVAFLVIIFIAALCVKILLRVALKILKEVGKGVTKLYRYITYKIKNNKGE